MGKLHYGKAPRPINKASEYLLVGGGETKKQADAILLQKLKGDEIIARRIGAALQVGRRNFALAYPNETRHTIISNEEWREQGFEALAETNALLRLTGS